MRRVWFAASVAAALLTSACAEQGHMPMMARRCADTRFPIYFKEGSDELTTPAHDVIVAQSRRMGACRVGAAEVLGLADATGSAANALDLSQRRAAVVAQALASAGLPAPSFDLQAAGADGALTASGRKAPLHRRVEVVLRAAPS